MPALPPSIASFTVRGGPLDGQRLDADEAVDEILIGSDSDCRFHLDAPGVSPIHARVWMDLDGVTVHDTHSPRGLYVNDDRVKGQARLRDRDILWLGAPGDESSVMIECRFASTAAEERDALADLVPAAPAAGHLAASAPAAEDALADLVPAESPAEARPAPADAHPDATLFAAPAGALSFRGEPQLEELLSPGPEPVLAPQPEPAQASDSGFDFFVEEPAAEARQAPPAPAPLDDLLVVDPGPPPAPDFVAAAPADDAFFVQDAASSGDAAPASATAEPEDVFFVDESSPAVTFDEPFVLDEPPAAAPAPPPAAAVTVPSAAAAIAPPTPAARPATPVPLAAQTQPVEPPPVPKRKPPRVRRPPPRAAAAPRAQPAAAPRAAAAKARGGLPPAAKYGAIGAVALLLLGGAALLLSRSTSAPKVEGLSPSRVAPGQILTLTGRDFAPQPQANAVRIEGRPARVLKATPTELQVEVPEVPAAGGRPGQAMVTVSVGGRESVPTPVTVYQSPRIHGVSPSVAMPGEEVTLAGTSWGLGAKVRFGSVEAPVVSATANALRVRVPEAAGAVGTSIPVVVSMGSETSNAFPFLLGRLPLVTGIDPKTASAGDVVTIAGRGFNVQAAANAVRIGGAPALVVSSSDADLKALVPRAAAPGPTVPVEVRVQGHDNVAQSTLTVSPPLDPVDFGFAADPFVDAAGHEHAVLTTGLGPAFVLSDSGGRSAAERALEAVRRLNAAAVPLRASRGEDLEVRGVDSDPVIVLMGKSDPILQVTEEDAAALQRGLDAARAQGRAGDARAPGPVVGRRGPRPGADARPWGIAAPRRGPGPGGQGPRGPVRRREADGPLRRAAVRGGRRPGRPPATRCGSWASASPRPWPAHQAPGARAPAATAGKPGLKLDGTWTGAESDSEGRKIVTVRFSGPSGSLSYQRALSVSVPLTGVEQPRKDSVRYAMKTAAGTRFYLGRWDGEKITGTIFSDAAHTLPIGSFELGPER